MHRIEKLEAKLAKAVGDLQSMPEDVLHTTLDDGPLWPEDRTGVWLAALHACKNVVQSKVDQILAELKGQDGRIDTRHWHSDDEYDPAYDDDEDEDNE